MQANTDFQIQNPSFSTPGINPAANDPFMMGAEQMLQDGQLEEFLKGKMTPDSAMMMQMMGKIAELLQLLIDQIKSGQNPMGEQQGGAPAGGAPAASGGAPAAGGHSGGGHSAGHDGVENVDGPNGFLWKPQSESDGNLVTLLPPDLKGKVSGVEIQDANGNVLDTGRFSGDQKNGGRPHFRFGKPGAAYGDNVRLVAKMNDGTTKSWPIARGAARND